MKEDKKLKKAKKMSQLYKNNWFAFGLLITSALLSIIAVTLYLYNPLIFSSFSFIVFAFIISIAGYMLYNIKKIANEVKNLKKS
ncbi:MAG: hypothetical protein ACTSQJ_09295 [Promethearchaeota archaeon]